jgi:hypothetical protein
MAHFVSSGAFSASTFNNSVTPALPLGYMAGDLFVLYAAQTTTGAHAVPSGWTAIVEMSHPDTALKSFLAYKVVTSSETAPTVVRTGGTLAAQIGLFRNVDNADPIYAVGTPAYNASQADVGPIPGITIAVSDPHRCVIVAGARSAAWSSVATLSGFTEIAERTAVPAMVWDTVAQVASTGSSISDQTFTVTASSNGYGSGVIVALNPMVSEVRAHQASLTTQIRPPSTVQVTQASLSTQIRPPSAVRVSQIELKVMLKLKSFWRSAIGVCQTSPNPGGWEAY